jgi:hypothetical protein
MLMRLNPLFVATALLLPTGVLAQDSYKVEVLKEGPPASVAPAVKGELSAQGYRVVDGQGKAYAEFWLRKAIPASGKPAGGKGAIQFPVLAEGELLGVLRFVAEGHDYRDQSIAPGVYTLRYGLQPVNGDHLGVSTYRDYVLLVPAGKDTSVAAIPTKPLQERSAESAGTTHPAVLMLLGAPADSKGDPSIVRDETKNTWGAVVPLSLSVKGEPAPVSLPVQLVVIGAAMA